MKVTAKNWINLDGTWYRPGEVYDDGTPERAEVTVVAEEEVPQEEPVAVEQQPKRSRKRTAKDA